MLRRASSGAQPSLISSKIAPAERDLQLGLLDRAIPASGPRPCSRGSRSRSRSRSRWPRSRWPRSRVVATVVAAGRRPGAAVVATPAVAARRRGRRRVLAPCTRCCACDLAGQGAAAVQRDRERAGVRAARRRRRRTGSCRRARCRPSCRRCRCPPVRVVPGLELAEVVQPVTVRVAPGLLDLQGKVVTALPAIGNAVVVAVDPGAARAGLVLGASGCTGRQAASGPRRALRPD